MTTFNTGEGYPLVLAEDYLNILERYRNLPSIRPAPTMPAKKVVAKRENPPKENFWKTLFSVKTLINVWMPTVMTVAGTLGGAVIGARYNMPAEPEHKPRPAIRKHEDYSVKTNQVTYIYNCPNDTNTQFGVVGQKDEKPQAFWIRNNDQGLKEVLVATQADQVILQKN